MRPFLGPGARGDVVEDLQRGLSALGHDTRGIDGVYGGNTATAVVAYQGAWGLEPTGLANDEIWTAVTGQPLASLERRCLALTAAIEGHGYSLALGNWDNAWLTWGIIGFNLRRGSLADLIREIARTLPGQFEAAFGPAAAELLAILDAPPGQQEAWANGITVGRDLKEPWRSRFDRLGKVPEVRALQRRYAVERYYLPAARTASRFDLRTELGFALCFDIHVQNGSVKPEGEAQARRNFGDDEASRRVSIANAVADFADEQYRADVRKRKLAIARGEGSVHGLTLKLVNWGLGEFAAV